MIVAGCIRQPDSLDQFFDAEEQRYKVKAYTSKTHTLMYSTDQGKTVSMSRSRLQMQQQQQQLWDSSNQFSLDEEYKHNYNNVYGMYDPDVEDMEDLKDLESHR